ncbi:bifunctional adenosylcobinamide kinase/adenosylcobinamide-phosphate guanylyltransferase [uncultured Hyphomonas sp.]|uniref:bifunctional adenosylcobinamide kinase/adenosylcobinamide-phosphate guanylyltransferase n=1 Tax=uncultured Hyphomonas sp. TaxID=225298 RepID=UPI002AAB33C1|nr:bifunctional adenosylcobinamide kinase/adenosylcobinamide-phosphate guanylyltransferase [uncultured Hyphomonas sp.]
MRHTFILGGARSGKSARAQTLAEKASSARVYIATAEAFDAEMSERIAHHQADRGEGWQTVEAPLDLVAALEDQRGKGEPVLVDCLTLWLSNLMHDDRDVEAETEKLCTCLSQLDCKVILVSNEVGLGLVPETALGRRFRDAQGRLNQRVAAVCEVVEFVAAGLPLRLKG